MPPCSTAVWTRSCWRGCRCRTGAGFLAGRAFLRYRRAGGVRASPLPGFYIGAHAAADDLTLVTRDAGRYRAYFPSVKLMTPGDHA